MVFTTGCRGISELNLVVILFVYGDMHLNRRFPFTFLMYRLSSEAFYKLFTLVCQFLVFPNTWEGERRPAFNPAQPWHTCRSAHTLLCHPTPVWIRTPSDPEMRHERAKSTRSLVPGGHSLKVDARPLPPAGQLVLCFIKAA